VVIDDGVGHRDDRRSRARSPDADAQLGLLAAEWTAAESPDAGIKASGGRERIATERHVAADDVAYRPVVDHPDIRAADDPEELRWKPRRCGVGP